jgi:thiamine-phosphate pyrophosphorylase
MKQGLYLIGPEMPESPDVLIEKIRKTAAIQTVDAFLYILPETAAAPDFDAMKKVCAAVQKEGIAFILKGTPEQAAAGGCDGVHMAFAPGIGTVRKKFPDRILGVLCSSRHEAMTAGEAGADYIAFSGQDATENTVWWAELFTVPCVLFCPDAPCPEADFIARPLQSFS